MYHFVLTLISLNSYYAECIVQNLKDTPFELLALLLLALPLLLTLQKLLELLVFGERSHQLVADTAYALYV